MEINFSNAKSKKKAIADAIQKAVVNGELCTNDNLLSINEASATYNVSRDTVFKAYAELKKSGVIDSNPQRGYFVKGDVHHVLLLLDIYSSFKQNLYRSFIANLPASYKVDLIFHQYNEQLFETIVRESIGKYSSYIIMNFSNEKFSSALELIPQQKLLLLDFGNFDKNGYSYICQDFGKSFYNCLKEANPLLSKYKKAVLIIPEETSHPNDTILYFESFCKSYQFEYEIISEQSEWKEVEASTFYICISNDDLVKIIKEATNNLLQIGTDIGVIRYNDEPLLEIIGNGISSISIDFKLMGEKAAQFVKSKDTVQEYLPVELIKRSSI